MKLLLIVLTFFFSINRLIAQDTLVVHYSRTITANELSEYLYKLASKDFEGRYTGSKGRIKAGEYIMGENSRKMAYRRPGLPANRIICRIIPLIIADGKISG